MQQYKKILGKVMMTAEGTYDSNKGYDPISLITDEETGKSYISRKEVPAGTQINNREYWQPVASSGIIDNGVIILNRKNSDGQVPIYDLKSAAEAVAVGDRKGGVILGFLGFNPETDTMPTWKLYQYNGVSPSNWTNIDYWLPMDYTNKYAGWFDNEEALYDSVPFPKIGMYAYVGNSVSSAIIYRCYNDRVWYPTEDKAFSGVVNLADEEDITSKQNKLKFKDKEYNPAQFSGLGKLYLRKNIVDGKNILTQTMMQATNTIYIIQYDYDLQGQTITIPEGCILNFQGGSIVNGSLDANKCKLLGSPKLSVNKIGLVNNGYYDLSWFVGIEDYSTLLQDIIEKSYVGLHKNEQIIIYVPKGEYIISNITWANPNTGGTNTNNRFAERLTIKGEGTGSVININSGDGITLIDRFLIEDVVIIGAKVKPAIKLGKTSTIYPDGNSIINRCHFAGNTAGAITSVDFLLDLNITNCYFTGNDNKEGAVVTLQGNSSTTFRVTKCYFSNNNTAKYCLYLNGNTNINIYDNIFESSGLLIYGYNCNMLSVDSNYFEYGTDYYVQVDKHSFDVHITNNFFRYNMCDKPFISLSNSGEKVVENNKFEWWGLGNIPNEGYIKGINITNLRYNNNSLSVRNPQTSRFENKGDYDINISTNNLKLYSSFQNGTSETGYPKDSDSNNYIEFVNNYGYADNNSYKIRLTSNLLRIPNTNYTYKAGNRYVVSFYLKFTEESKDNTVEVLFTGASAIGEALISGKGTDWKRYQFEILQDVGNVDVGIYFKPYIYATGACEFYIDDVQIERKEIGFAGDYILTNNISLPYTKNNLAISPNLFNTSFKVEGEGWYRVLKLNYVPALLSLYVYKSYTYSPFECQVINIGCKYNTTHNAYSMFGSIFTKFRIVQVESVYYLELYYNNAYVNEISIVIDNYITFEKCNLIPVVKDAEYNTIVSSGIIAQSITQSGTSSNRPTNVNSGYQYFDANLNKPIWWTGTKWIDSTGAEV